jgi:hypothetical protein
MCLFEKEFFLKEDQTSQIDMFDGKVQSASRQFWQMKLAATFLLHEQIVSRDFFRCFAVMFVYSRPNLVTLLVQRPT